MQGYKSFLPTPTAAPGVTAGSTFTVRTRRKNASGTVTAASPSDTIDFPGTITPQALDAGFPSGELTEDEILISADSGATFYKIARASTLTGAYTISSYTAGSGTLVSGAEITSGTQSPDYSGVDYAVRIGSPETKKLFLLNEGGLTLTDLLMSVINPENDEAQTELSGHFQIDYLGNFDPDGTGAISGTPASVLWDAEAGIRSEIPLTLDSGRAAVFDITISLPAGGSSEGAIPWRLDIQDTANVISIATVPGWARGTFLISREFGTSLPILSVVSGSVNINRCYVNIGRNLAAVNRSALPATLSTATGYKFYVSGNGVFSFTTDDVPSGSFHLATFDWDDSTDTISNFVYETGIATASYLEIPTDQSLTIGQAVKVQDNSGSLNCLATTTNAEPTIGFVSKKPAGGYVGVSIGGQAFAIASAAITIADALNSAAAGKVRTVSADEREDAVAFEAASADGDYLLVKVQPTGVSGSGGGGGGGDVVDDTTPQLGGNLDVNGSSIVSVSDGDITIAPNGTGSVILDGLNWPQSDGSANQVLSTTGSGELVFVDQTGGGAENVDVSSFSDVDLGSTDIVILGAQADVSESSLAYMHTGKEIIFRGTIYLSSVTENNLIDLRPIIDVGLTAAGATLDKDALGIANSAAPSGRFLPLLVGEALAYDANASQTGISASLGGYAVMRMNDAGVVQDFIFIASQSSSSVSNDDRWGPITGEPFTWAVDDAVTFKVTLPVVEDNRGGGVPDLVINSQSAAFSVTSINANRSINLNAASAAFTVTLDALAANAFVDFAKRDSSANAVTLAAGSGVTVRTAAAGLNIAGQYSRAQCRFDLDNNEWICSGDLS